MDKQEAIQQKKNAGAVVGQAPASAASEQGTILSLVIRKSVSNAGGVGLANDAEVGAGLKRDEDSPSRSKFRALRGSVIPERRYTDRGPIKSRLGGR